MQAQKKELDHIRQNYRKNSLYRSSSSAGSAATKKKMFSTANAPSDVAEETEAKIEVDSFTIPEEPASDSPKVQRIKVVTRDTDTE